MKVKRTDYNKEIFSRFIELFIVIFILICCGWLIYTNTREISPEQVSAVRKTFMPGKQHLLFPEFREHITFIVLTLLSVPLCIAVIYSGRKLRNIRKLSDICSSYGIIALNVFVLLLVFTCLYQPYIYPQFMYILFDPVWNYHFLLLTVIILTVFIIYAIFKWNLNKWTHGILILLLFIPLLQVLTCRLYSSLELVCNSVPAHPNIVAYAISQAAAGNTDYHQYGFYARMLAPFFRINSPNMLNISIAMAFLFLTAVLAIYWVLFRNVKNKILVPAFAFIFFLTSNTWAFLHVDKLASCIEPYFAYYPVRFMFPALAVLFFYVQACFKKKYFIFICGILSGISLWWNFDSGTAVAGAFSALMFLELVFSRSRSSSVQLLSFFISAGLAFLVLLFVFSIQQGEIISPEETFKYIKIFSSLGFMMMPLPGLPAPWCFFIGIYLLGIIIGLRSFIIGRFSISAKMSLFLSVLGIGLFTYYQGRSHIYSLPPVIWPALLLMFIHTDRVIRLVRNGLVSKYFKLLLAPAVFMSFCAMVTIIAGGKMITLGVERTFRCMASVDNPCLLEQNVRFIMANVNDHKVINIVSDMQGVYYAETGLKAGIGNFDVVELFFIEDWTRVVNELRKASVPLFIEQQGKQRKQIVPWIYEYYILKAVSRDGSLFYFVPKNKDKLPKPDTGLR